MPESTLKQTQKQKQNTQGKGRTTREPSRPNSLFKGTKHKIVELLPKWVAFLLSSLACLLYNITKYLLWTNLKL
jgi:hypothetical protein